MTDDPRDESGWPLVALNDDGIRPAGEPDRCFYCRQAVGQPHTRKCVMVQKVIRARYVFEVDLLVPHHWDKQTFEFHRNESSLCANNAIQDLQGQPDGCLCSRFKAEFVRVIDEDPTRDLNPASHAATVAKGTVS